MTIERKTAIVLIDVQGKLADIMYDSDKLFNNLEILIKGAQLLDIPIIWTEQVPEKLGSTTKRISTLLTNQNPIIKSESLSSFRIDIMGPSEFMSSWILYNVIFDFYKFNAILILSLTNSFVND